MHSTTYYADKNRFVVPLRFVFPLAPFAGVVDAPGFDC